MSIITTGHPCLSKARSLFFRNRDFKSHSQNKLPLEKPFLNPFSSLKPYTFCQQHGSPKVPTILFSASKNFRDERGSNSKKHKDWSHIFKNKVLLVDIIKHITTWLILPEMYSLNIIARKQPHTLQMCDQLSERSFCVIFGACCILFCI